MVPYKVGDVVECRRGLKVRQVKVTLKRKNIKDGRAGFQGEIVFDSHETWKPGDLAWGYDTQIERVIEQLKGKK